MTTASKVYKWKITVFHRLVVIANHYFPLFKMLILMGGRVSVREIFIDD